MDVQLLAEQIRTALPSVKGGSPRFWGVWHTKPYDSYLQIENCHVEDHHLVISLVDVDSQRSQWQDGLGWNGDLLLHGWSPDGLTCTKETFSISKAGRIRLEPKSTEPSKGESAWSLDLSLRDGVVLADVSGTPKREKYASPQKAAVEFLEYGDSKPKSALSTLLSFFTS